MLAAYLKERLVACGQRAGQRRNDFSSVSLGRQRKFLVAILELVEPVVDPALRKQFLVRALFAQSALMKHKDSVGVLDRAQSMSDDESRTSREQPVQRLANLEFGLGVHA